MKERQSIVLVHQHEADNVAVLGVVSGWARSSLRTGNRREGLLFFTIVFDADCGNMRGAVDRRQIVLMLNPKEMTMYRRRETAAIGIGTLLVLTLFLGSVRAEERKFDSQAGSGSGANPKLKKMVDQFNRKLGRMKPHQGGLKKVEDLFVVGTAEVNRETGHADVTFKLSEGQRETAEFLVGYISDQSSSKHRKWQVFYRVGDKSTGNEALAHVREQYDKAVSYRQQLMKAYKARSIRRC